MKHLSPFPFLESLQGISGIKFTPQEVNILSCYVSGRSRDTIAALLDISPKTVEAHTSKITSKLNIQYGGKQRIVLFAEKSDKYKELREHYEHLLKWRDFIKVLKKTKEALPEKKLCNVTFESRLLEIFWKEAFKSLELRYRKAQNDPHIHITNSGRIKLNGELFPFYEGILSLLKYLYPKEEINNFENSLKEFSNEAKNFVEDGSSLNIKVNTRRIILLPSPTIVDPLPRQPLLNQVTNKLNGEGIRIVSFFGIGGSGKSTLAQNYASQSNADIICYIKAESKESVFNSFKRFAYELLEDFSDSFTFLETINKVRHELKKRNGKWLLIYDDVKNFQDLELSFPLNFLEWGEGKVILTTRDENLLNKINLTNVNHIHLGELNREEKYDLFINICNEERDKNLAPLLDIIPPFPLDISTAAHYLKENNHISYQDYIDLINNPNKDFNDFQDEIFLIHNSYGYTRYKIVKESLENIVRQDEKNKSILLFISLLHPEDISKQILYALNNRPLKIDRLIFNLKNSGLVKVHVDNIIFHSVIHASISLFIKKVITPQEYRDDLENFTSTFRDLNNKVREEDNLWEAHKLLNTIEYFSKKTQINKEILLPNFQPNRQSEIKNKLLKYFRYLLSIISNLKIYKKETITVHNIQNDRIKMTILSIRLNTYLAQLHFYLLNYHESLKHREIAWKLCYYLHGKSNFHTLNTLLSLGNAWEACGSFSKAKEIYENCLKLSYKTYGKSHDFTNIVNLTLKSLGKKLKEDIDDPIYFNKIFLPEISKKAKDIIYKKTNQDILESNYSNLSSEEIKDIIEKKTGITFSPREITILCLFGLGFTTKEIGYLTQTSPRFILERDMIALLDKLDLQNKNDMKEFFYKNLLSHVLMPSFEIIEKRLNFHATLKQFSQENQTKLKLYIPRIEQINPALNKVKGHLMLAGVRFSEDDSNPDDIPIHILGTSYQPIDHSKFISKPIYLCLHKDKIIDSSSVDFSRLIDFMNEKEYMTSFLKFLNLLKE